MATSRVITIGESKAIISKNRVIIRLDRTNGLMRIRIKPLRPNDSIRDETADLVRNVERELARKLAKAGEGFKGESLGIVVEDTGETRLMMAQAMSIALVIAGMVHQRFDTVTICEDSQARHFIVTMVRDGSIRKRGDRFELMRQKHC
jgi:hypothetical protein